MPEDISQFFDNRQTQTFHPIHRREAEFWHPGNDAASLRIHISHIWEDIIMLRDMLLRSENNIEQRLLFKYILVELHSILSPIARLQTIIMTVPVAKQGKPTPFHSISVEDKETAKQLFKVHNIAKNKTESLLADIRNDIGAHRGLQPWERIIQLGKVLSRNILTI